MKQIIRLYTLLVASCLLLAGCNSNEDVGDLGDPVAVQFGMGEISRLKTTSGGDQWSLNDLIGIFMVKNGQSLNSTNIAEGADNVEYKAQTDGNAISGFAPASGTPIFYPHNGDNVDFIAYYPYKLPLINYTYPVDVSNQTTPADIDILYANTANTSSSGYNKNSGTVDLQFSHVLSKLSFMLTSGDGSPSLAGAKVEITNQATTADMSLADGIVTATNSGNTIIANTATNGLSSSAIVIPQTLSGTKLIVTLADNVNKFEWDFPANTESLAGKNHQYNITVSKTGIKVSSSGITIWTGTGDPATGGMAQAGYKVGDYYPDPTAVYQNGTLISGTAAVGLVFWLDNQSVGDHPYNKVSQHGKIVGLYERASSLLDASCMVWVTDYGTTYNAGTGWYIPAYGEKDYYNLYCAYNGMNYETWDTGKPNDISKNYTERAWFRKKITDAGGDNITDSWYWVSSVNGINNAYRLHFNSGNVELSGNILTSNKLRAIKTF